MSAQMNAIVRRIERHQLIFDFDRGGLGERMVMVVAEEIMRAMDQECSPKGGHWKHLADGYRAWKDKYFPGQPMAVLTGHMKQLQQLVGLCRVTAREVLQTYGVDETARALAEWFQEGKKDGKGDYVQPPRPFFLFGDVVRARLKELLDAHFASSV